MLRDAVDIELIDANPAARLRVRPADPRLDPERGPVRRRAVPPGEIRAFMAQVTPSQRGCCWAPVMTGCRPGELFAMHAEEIDRETHMIYLHETVDRYGRLMRGLKGSHHVGDREKRGRWTLFPAQLGVLVEAAVGPTLHTGRLWTAEPRPLSHLYGTDAAPAADYRGLPRRAKGDANVTSQTTNSAICRQFSSRTPALSRRRSRVPAPSLP
jgi:hypothetical protein